MGGDLSNEISPRWFVQFERLVGVHETPAKTSASETYLTVRQFKRYIGTYTPDQISRKCAWDLAWRRDIRLELLTFTPEKCADHIDRWVEHYGLPFRAIRRYESPAHLGRDLADLVDVTRVVHCDPEAAFAYGGRGVLVSPGQLWNG